MPVKGQWIEKCQELQTKERRATEVASGPILRLMIWSYIFMFWKFC